MNKLFWFLPLVLVVGCASKPQIVEVEVPAKPKVADAAPQPVQPQYQQPQIIIQQAPPTPQVQQPAWVVGPSNNPNVVTGFKDVEYMQRNEVIQASKDCTDNRMKPVIQYVPQKTSHGTLMLPAMVNCEVIPGYTVPVENQKVIVQKQVNISNNNQNQSTSKNVSWGYDHDKYLEWVERVNQ